MKLLLICETMIIEHIFKLVCNKLDIEFFSQKSTTINDNFDFIVIDQNFIDDKFNLIKQFSQKLAAISSEDLPFDKSKDFLIPRPFLPNTLVKILEEQISSLEKNNKIKSIKNIVLPDIQSDDYIEDEEVTIPVSEYAQFIQKKEIEEEKIIKQEDESIVKKDDFDEGILDKEELSKINLLLSLNEKEKASQKEEDDWKNLSAIIDDALGNKLYEFDIPSDNISSSEDKPYTLVLNPIQVGELKQILDEQDKVIVNKLSNGETLNIKMNTKG